MKISSVFGTSNRRGLSAVIGAATLLALCALPAGALATESTTTASAATTSEVSNYSATPTVTTMTESKATHEVKPEKEKAQPKHGVKPKKEAVTPPAVTTTTTTSSQAKKSSLPFTGLNLTWLVGAGVLLLGLGLSIRMVARRAH